MALRGSPGSPLEGLSVQLCVSSRDVVNVSTAQKELSGVPEQAYSFVYCYPPLSLTSSDSAFPEEGPERDFLTHGGFVYFDLSDKVVQVIPKQLPFARAGYSETPAVTHPPRLGECLHGDKEP